ncbi:SMP-30/gluconolactonase/LRE family protein [Dactylosporangium sp. NPDC000555]|uniref:SMP-30/gluconolactonase/LRE family protein n=1 Tax=Dactylosporangium sp. NPDC000555 TaxID=3154260 RepID=UPI003325BB83
MRPRSTGGAVIGTATGFLLEASDGTPTHRYDILDDVAIRMNDGACDPDGRCYCGSMHESAEPGSGTLFRLDSDGGIDPVLTDLTISNGLDWTASGDTAYFADSATGRIDQFDYDSGLGLTGRRTAAAIDPRLGLPDGLTVDAEGGIWVALWGGSAVHRYTPDGRLDHVIEVAAALVSSCTFGGPRLDELFITTSRLGARPRRRYRRRLAVSRLPRRHRPAGAPVPGLSGPPPTGSVDHGA